VGRAIPTDPSSLAPSLAPIPAPAPYHPDPATVPSVAGVLAGIAQIAVVEGGIAVAVDEGGIAVGRTVPARRAPGLTAVGLCTCVAAQLGDHLCVAVAVRAQGGPVGRWGLC
jgi:hypothetical protein